MTFERLNFPFQAKLLGFLQGEAQRLKSAVGGPKHLGWVEERVHIWNATAQERVAAVAFRGLKSPMR